MMARLKTKTEAFKSSLLSTLPWDHTSFGDGAEIEACVTGTDKWETIADVRPFLGFDGEDIAAYIVCAVNNHEKMRAQLQKANKALELCLSCEGLSPKTRQKVNEVLKAISETNKVVAN